MQSEFIQGSSSGSDSGGDSGGGGGGFGGGGQQSKTTFEDGLRKVLKSAKVGQKISSRDLVTKYNVPQKAASLINSFTKVSKNSIEVDWISSFNPKMVALSPFSDAVFNDGTINITNMSDGTLRITGDGIGIEFEGEVYYNIFLNGNNAKIPQTKKFSWDIINE